MSSRLNVAASYIRVLAVLILEGDMNALAADDKVERKLLDLSMRRRRNMRDPRQQFTTVALASSSMNSELAAQSPSAS